MRVAQNLILIPVFVQAFLTFAVLGVLLVRRAQSLRDSRAALQDMAVADDGDWQRPADIASRHFKNQFEMPVLFYAVCGFALVTRNVDSVFLTLAALFVLSRIGHSIVHLTSNVVVVRGGIYAVGAACVFLMWVLLAWRVFAVGF